MFCIKFKVQKNFKFKHFIDERELLISIHLDILHSYMI